MRYTHVVAFTNGIVYFCKNNEVATWIMENFHRFDSAYVYTVEAWLRSEHRFHVKRDKYTMVMVRAMTKKPQSASTMLRATYEVEV